MSHFKFVIFFISSLFLLTGCGSSNNGPGPVSCSDEDYNQFVYDRMKSRYYWYDEVDPFNTINPKDTIAYPTPQSLIDVLKYSTLDRFSGVGNAASFNQFFGEGKFLGTGLRLLTDETTGDLMIAYAFVNGDAYAQGIRRGDRIVTIGNYAANGISNEDYATAWGAREVGVTVDLEIQKSGETTTSTVTVTKSIITILSTQNSTTITSGLKKVGYLHFTSFLGSTAIQDLDNQFTSFLNDNISELIVDLRYNGGGSVATAQHLASLIGGNKTSGSIFSTLFFNNNPRGYHGKTERNYFYTADKSLNLSKVIFITTGSSCSASELVINSLIPNPNIDVIVVGSTTCGKPVGSVPHLECGKSLSLINFEVKNSANQGGYFNGIDENYVANGLTAFCSASDDINLGLGDITEDSVSAALYYINNNKCDLTKLKSARQLKSRSGLKQEGYSELDDLY